MIEKLSLRCDEVPSQRQLACCPSYCSLPQGKDITIYNHVDTEQQPLLLTGHHGEVTAMTFGEGSRPVLLCSASADYIIVWDVELCQRRSQEGRVAAGTVIGSLLGEIVHLSFCFTDERVAACSGTTVYILSSKRQEVIAALNGHLGPLTSAEFCPWDEEVLVTTSQDRTFKVWDLKAEAVRYQSHVLSASPLLGVFFMEESRQLVTGATDGQVWCFSLPADHKCHLVTKMDLQKMEKRHKTHRGAGSQQAGVTEQSSDSEVEVSKSVLKMASCSSMSGPRGDLTTDNSWLYIGSYDGLYVVDLATSELLMVFYFKDFPNLSIKMTGSWSISLGWENSMVFLVGAMFTPCAVLLELRLCDLEQIWSGTEGFSVFPSSPLLPDSPLNADFTRKQPSHPEKKGIKEHSLVFHSKVKSSGYTNAPRRIMFSPKTNNRKNPSSKKSPKDTGLFLRDYPADTAAPTIQRVGLSTGSKPVYCLQYSGDGKQILCGLGDNSVLLYKSSLSGNPAVYTGHDKPVNSVSWSLNRQDWLSASEDQSLRIWSRGSPKPAIIMNKFSKPIRSAQYYYLDKFLLLASGASLYLYLYDVDTTHDDIKRYQQRSAVKLARRFETSAATDITAMSAISDFFSYVVLVSGSDRSVQVFDMNRGSVASVLPDAHSRAVHCITQNKGSMFSTQAPESYNLFLTSGAVTDGVKIWDLRTLGCVRRYENHVNRCHPCESAISPCGRFIASGSEDNCAYVYDIRSSSFLHRLQKHSDTVLRVAFNPATPELLTGTLDGRLRLFESSSGAQLSHDTSAAVHRVPDTTT